MSLLSFKNWRESSASTRQRDGWLRGLYPPRADFMSRSTPSPATIEKMKDIVFQTDEPKKKKSKKKKRKKIEESKAKVPVIDQNVDKWLKSIEGLSKDLEDLEKAKKSVRNKLDQIKDKYNTNSVKKDDIEKDEKDKKEIDKEEKDSDVIKKQEVEKNATAKPPVRLSQKETKSKQI